MTFPLITTIITVHDRTEYINDAIDSVIAQDYDNIEIVIIDDSVKTDIQPIISEYLTHPKIRYIKQDDKGLAGARNTGITNANGSFLVFLDDDDLLCSNKYKVQSKILLENPEYSFVYSQEFHLKNNKQDDIPVGHKILTDKGLSCTDIFLYGGIAVHACMCRKEQALNIDMFDETNLSNEDDDFWFRLSAVHGNAIFSDYVSCIRRLHHNTMSSNRQRMSLYIFKTWEKLNQNFGYAFNTKDSNIYCRYKQIRAEYLLYKLSNEKFSSKNESNEFHNLREYISPHVRRHFLSEIKNQIDNRIFNQNLLETFQFDLPLEFKYAIKLKSRLVYYFIKAIKKADNFLYTFRISNKIITSLLYFVSRIQNLNKKTNKSNSLEVLHVFNYYLNNSENWMFRILTSMSKNIRISIAAQNLLKNSFYEEEFRLLKCPFQVKVPTYNIFYKFLNRMSNKLKEYVSFENNIGNLLRKNDFALIHAHYSIIGVSMIGIIQQYKIPLVVSFYGYDYESLPFKKPYYNEQYQKLFKIADLFICEGNHGKSILVKNGCPVDKIRVIKLGIDPDNIPFFQRMKQKNKLSLLQIASFVEKKGHIYTIKAFHKALKKCDNMHLTLVGPSSGNIKNEIESYTFHHNLGNYVTFIDKIEYQNLYNFMEGYDVFIHPSCYTEDMDCEGGAPVVILDAQATGMPIISTYHCDIPDEVINKKTGLLCEEKDIEGISNSIEYFYQLENSEYQKYAMNAREHVENEYNINNNYQILPEIYSQIVYKKAKIN